MWSLVKKRHGGCSEFRGQLEVAASALPELHSPAELLESLPQSAQSHAAACKDCRSALEDLLLSRRLLREFHPYTRIEKPWFVPRVMNLIAAREAESRRAESAWVAVPRLASRVTWITALLLLVTGTWLYEKPAQKPARQTTKESIQESIFENSQPPAVDDDVLVNVSENGQ
jgi:hypothetical protein